MLSPAMVSMKGIPADTMQFGKSKVSLLLSGCGVEGRGWLHRMARLVVSDGVTPIPLVLLQLKPKAGVKFSARNGRPRLRVSSV